MRNSRNRLVVALSVGMLLLAGNALAADAKGEAKGTIDPVSGKPCYKCHMSKVNGPNTHSALADKECTPCHANSGGDHQKDHQIYAVKDKSAKLCWQCHDSVEKQKSVHPIISDEGCLGCHAPHASSLGKLLREESPALCFQCHDAKLVQERETQKGTGFRDGTQSLHYVHAGKNAIQCLACHDVHASSQMHLIRPKGANGKDAVTITYTATEKGGSCAASCHDTLSYARK